MSLLRFTIQDYHAIKSADIKIDGITVLAGENGSGKSTLSRWIYYLINSMISFEEISYFRLFDELNDKITRFYRFTPDADFRNALYSFDVKLNQQDEDFVTYLSRVIELLERNILDLMSRDNSSLTRSRILSLVGLKEDTYMDDVNLEGVIVSYFKRIYNNYLEKYVRVREQVLSKRMEDLYEFIAYSYHTTEDFPNNISLLENEQHLIKAGVFVEPYIIGKALYIDSSVPTSLNSRPDDDAIGQITRNMIHNSMSTELSSSAKQILYRMMRVINGTISLKENGKTFSTKKELRYCRRDGLEIPLRNAASGIQAVAYLYRLLECGYLGSDTLLLIDEPETHLHPQWVVEYANILVSLQKELGVKIVIASHSPDMVSAIETISRRHQLENQTRFYQARQESDMKYVFDDLQNNIAGIFESFNVAFSKMQDYGADL